MFIHKKEDIMWILLGINPTNFPIIQLGLNNESKIINVQIEVREKMDYFLDLPNSPCKTYVDGPIGLNNCSQSYITSHLKENINCTIPG